ncbi:MAG: 6-phosphogluconolactonase [Deltaproteobacteria bacterium]|nr:MAG: 6-phosphogluconolactonase [Deltaproteobacteria bacterium]
MSVTIRTSDDPVAEAASALTSAIRDALADRQYVTVAVPGGSALAAWSRTAEELGEDLGRVRLTWVDERCVPVADPQSNRGQTHRSTDARAGDELPLWLDDETEGAAIARVRAGLKAWGCALDVSLLGMGPDGHIASLFPNRSWAGDTVMHIADSPKPPPHRMTLTLSMLATAQTSILVATGESKRDAMVALATGDPTLPAGGLPGLTVFTDLDFASGSTT